MPNPLQTYLNPPQTVALYQGVVQLLGQDEIIFLSMSLIAQRRRFAFDLPVNLGEYPQKHQEIENSFTRYHNFPDRQGLFFDLINEIQTQLQINGQDLHANRLRDFVSIATAKDFNVLISGDCAWIVEWAVANPDDSSDERKIPATVYQGVWGNVIPWTVLQYLNGGILLYKQKSYATALALLSIAVEATLRDVLSTRGYTFTMRANKQDIYDFSRALVHVNGANYTLTFPDPMPKQPTELNTSSGGVLPIEIRVRRDGNPAREDLLIRAPQFLIDHWSGNRIIQPAQTNSVDGLGEALRIARSVEGVVTPLDLPIDVDDVVKAVRNNLIHLSSDSMDVELPKFASLNPNGKFTVKDFIDKPNLVFDFVIDIPRFVNEQYVKLWKAGTHI